MNEGQQYFLGDDERSETVIAGDTSPDDPNLLAKTKIVTSPGEQSLRYSMENILRELPAEIREECIERILVAPAASKSEAIGRVIASYALNNRYINERTIGEYFLTLSSRHTVVSLSHFIETITTPEGDDITYHVETEVAKGGMGRVTQVIDMYGNRSAMKTMLNLSVKPEFSETINGAPQWSLVNNGNPRDEDRLQRASDEVRAAVIMEENFPGAVPPVLVAGIKRVVEFEDDPKKMQVRYEPVIVQKMIWGETMQELMDRMPEKRLSVEECMDRLLPIVTILMWAHSLKMIHRDIKPANMMLDGTELAMLLADWGLVQHQEDREKDDRREKLMRSQLTQEGVGLGTPMYMAPEQVNNARNATKATDIHNLVKVIAHMITGQPMYVGVQSMDEITRFILAKKVPDSFWSTLKAVLHPHGKKGERLLSVMRSAIEDDQLDRPTAQQLGIAMLPLTTYGKEYLGAARDDQDRELAFAQYVQDLKTDYASKGAKKLPQRILGGKYGEPEPLTIKERKQLRIGRREAIAMGVAGTIAALFGARQILNTTPDEPVAPENIDWLDGRNSFIQKQNGVLKIFKEGSPNHMSFVEISDGKEERLKLKTPGARKTNTFIERVSTENIQVIEAVIWDIVQMADLLDKDTPGGLDAGVQKNGMLCLTLIDKKSGKVVIVVKEAGGNPEQIIGILEVDEKGSITRRYSTHEPRFTFKGAPKPNEKTNENLEHQTLLTTVNAMESTPVRELFLAAEKAGIMPEHEGPDTLSSAVVRHWLRVIKDPTALLQLKLRYKREKEESERRVREIKARAALTMKKQ